MARKRSKRCALHSQTTTLDTWLQPQTAPPLPQHTVDDTPTVAPQPLPSPDDPVDVTPQSQVADAPPQPPQPPPQPQSPPQPPHSHFTIPQPPLDTPPTPTLPPPLSPIPTDPGMDLHDNAQPSTTDIVAFEPASTPSLGRTGVQFPVVNSMSDAFEWPSFMLNAATSNDPSTLQHVAGMLSSFDYTECFAGISGHGVGIGELVREIRRRDPDFSGPRCLARVDNWEFSIAETLLLNDGACQFADICDFFLPSVKSLLPTLQKHPHKIVDSLLPITMAGCAVKTTAACRRHPGCECEFPFAPLCIGSTVCTAESTMNCSRPGTADPSTLSTIAFCCLIRKTRPLHVLHECVRGRKGFILSVLGDLYWSDDCEIDPYDLGWPYHKNRQWLVLTDNAHCPPVARSLSDFKTSMLRVCNWSWLSIFCVHEFPDDLGWDRDFIGAVNILDDELDAELTWAANRVESLAHCGVPPSSSETGCFRKCLTAMEHKHLYITSHHL